MKLFSLRLTALKSKLYAIVFASFIVRVVAFFALPNTTSNLALDEGNYAGLTEWIAQGNPDYKYPYTSLYTNSRSLIFPASLLNKLGINRLDSVRIISSLYGFLACLLLANLFLKLYKFKQVRSGEFVPRHSTFLCLFAAFVFLPSHLTWSLLGLRESAVEFWTLLVFVLVLYVFEAKKRPSILALIGILIAIPLVFMSRPQVGLLLGVTLVIFSLIKVKVKISWVLACITLVGIVLGYAATTGFSNVAADNWSLRLETIDKKLANTSPTQLETIDKKLANTSPTQHEQDIAIKKCAVEGQKVVIEGIFYICINSVSKKFNGFASLGSAVYNQAEAIPERSEANKVGAGSAIKTIACPNKGQSRIDSYFCIAYRAPYTTFTFLFRPMLGADVTNTSSLFAAIENIFWLAAFLFVIVMLIRNRRLAFFGALAPSLLFFFFYSVSAGAYEGNMGTAFRHRSLILWVVILLLASTILASQQRKAEREGISGSSQE